MLPWHFTKIFYLCKLLLLQFNSFSHYAREKKSSALAKLLGLRQVAAVVCKYWAIEAATVDDRIYNMAATLQRNNIMEDGPVAIANLLPCTGIYVDI